MALTQFSDGNPATGQRGTTILSAFMNKIFGRATGHVHDGLDEDGHAPAIRAVVTNVTGNYVVDSGDFEDGVLVVDAAGGNVVVTLPPASDSGRRITVRRIDGSANTVTIATPDSSLVETLTTLPLGKYEHVNLWADGLNWWMETSAQAGDIIATASGTAPVGTLFCNGAAISRSTYARLFARVGTAFGTGNGTSTFNLPDLRDRVLAGAGPALSLGGAGGALTGSAALNGDHTHTADAATGGAHTHSVYVNNHTLTAAQIPAHTHKLPRSLTGWGGGSGTNNIAGHTDSVWDYDSASTGGGGAHNHGGSASWQDAHDHGVTVHTDGDHVHAVTVERQPHAVANFAIKF